MGTIIILLFLLFACIASGIGLGIYNKKPIPGAIGGLITGFVLCLLIGGYQSYHKIDSGEVGIVYGPSGSISGQMNHGGWLAPWNSVRTVDTRITKLEFDNLQTYAKQPINVPVDVTLNYRVDPDHVQSLIKNVGFDFATKLIGSRVYNDLKDETVKYDIRTLQTHREDIRTNVAEHLRTELQPYSISIESLQVKNINLPRSITGAENERQVATINSQTAQNQVAVVKAQADQVAAKAEGDKRAAVAKAQGEAEANRLIAASIARNPRIIDYTKAQAMLALANNPNTKVIPSGSIFNFGNTP